MKRDYKFTREELPGAVYYVESPEDDTVLVGMEVTIERRGRGEQKSILVSWYDTVHERAMMAVEIEREGDRLGFRRVESEGGGTYRFMPMTLEIYNEKVKGRLMHGRDFEHEDEMLEAFLATMRDEA